MKKVKGNLILIALISSLLLFILIIPFGKVFTMATDGVGLTHTKAQDKHGLYPDSIQQVYLIDNHNDPTRDLARFSFLVPITITNAYSQNQYYEMSFSAAKTYLSQTIRKSEYYKTSQGKYFKKRTNRRIPILYELLHLGTIPDELPDFYQRTRKTCRTYNPNFINECNSINDISFDLQPAETSPTFYLDFPISYWNEALLTYDATFELRLVKNQVYYPIPVQELVDCRENAQYIDPRCTQITS